MSQTFKTPKGTELPILDLRGKDYLEVKFRIVWFREERPNWTIETEIITNTPTLATAKATIKDETGRVIATSHKTEDKAGFNDFLEKSETGAIGRALALCGFGTQFCADELDEGKRIVDSPVSRQQARPQAKAAATKPHAIADGRKVRSTDPGDFVISFGSHKGKKLGDLPIQAIENAVNWVDSLDNAGTGLQIFREYALAYLESQAEQPA
jgi:hypothetical protein